MSITPLPNANFTPTMGTYNTPQTFRFWCQKVLPLVYDDSLSYYELLCKVVDYLNKTMEDVNTAVEDVTNLHTAYEQLQTYVNTYFDSLDVQEEINNKLDTMANDGSLTALISPLLPELIADWLDENITPTTPPIDKTLTIENAAADALYTGINIKAQVKANHSTNVDNLLSDITYNNTVRGIKAVKAGNALYLNGTLSPDYTVANFEFYNGDNIFELNKRYMVDFSHTNQNLIFQIFGYRSNGDAIAIYDSKTLDLNSFYVSNDYTDRIMIRVRYEEVGSLNEICTIVIREAKSNNDLTDYVDALKNDLAFVAENIVDFSSINALRENGLTANIDLNNKTITYNGTARATTSHRIATFTSANIARISGCPSGGGSAIYNIALFEGGNRIGYVSNNETKIFTLNPGLEYNVRIVIFEGVNANNLKFTPKIYLDSAIDKIEESISETSAELEALTFIPDYEVYSGTCFISHCGNVCIIDCASLRLHNIKTNEYTAADNNTYVLNLASSTAHYLAYDSENLFYFTDGNIITNNSIAKINNRNVHNLIDGIICNYRKIQDGYIRPNGNFYLNFKRTTFDALLAYASTNAVKVSKRGYIIKSAGRKSYNIKNVNIQFTLTENNTDITNKKILMIGDSFVARGYIQNYLKAFEPTLEFIGTRTTQHYDFKSEGVSGSRLYYFTDEETSPFWFNGQLNFSQYLIQNELTEPDFVIINSAINHGAYSTDGEGTYLENLTALINMIYSYNPNIKIYVAFGANYAVEPASSYGYPSNRKNAVLSCDNSTYNVDHITVVPIDTCLIDGLDYQVEDYTYFNKTIKILSDCVHPVEQTGFYKIAEMFYNYLGI